MSIVHHPVAAAPLAPVTPRTWARVRALLHPGALDRRLAAGADPARDRELAARAAILLRRSTRLQIAEGLASAVMSARSRAVAHSLSAVIPVAGRPVREAGDELAALAERLRAPEPVRPQGVALARELLVDGAGPLYVSTSGDELARTARHARRALDSGTAWA